jgi:hypothetical protein
VHTHAAVFRRNAGSEPVCGRDRAFRRNTVTLLRDPDDLAAYDESLAKITIGELQPLNGRIEIREYDMADYVAELG